MATELRDRLPNAQPTHIGRYEIVRKLGVGGMARVYLAVQRGPFGADKVVVVKQLRPEVADDQVFVSQFLNEARIALRLNHPNVVHTYDAVAEPGSYFMALEFLDGHSLSEIVRLVGAGRIPLNDSLWILTQVLAGLHYAHQLRTFEGDLLGIVHRDVSPSNVFVTHEGKVKLLDFGIAKATSALSSTQQGIVKGKVGYAAPEQLTADPVDARSDVYAAGVMLWEAIAGRRMWTGGTYLATLQARLEQREPAPLKELCPNASSALVAICRKALSPDPADRHATALELQQDIEGYLTSVHATASAESLRAFMSTHFPHDVTALRRDLARSVVPMTLVLPEPSVPEGEASLLKEKAPVDQPSRRRRLATVISAVLLVGAVGTGFEVSRRRDGASNVRKESSAPARQEMPLTNAPSQSFADAPSARRAEPDPVLGGASDTDSTRLAPTEELVVAAPAESCDVPPAKGRPSSPSRPKRKGTAAAASRSRAFGTPPGSARDTRHPDAIEPGMNLHLRGHARPVRSVDESDPYALPYRNSDTP